MKPTDAFKGYRLRYPAKVMRRDPANSDELRRMTTSDGMNDLAEAPAAASAFAKSPGLPNSADSADHGRHLWVISESTFPYALELCPWGAKLQSGRIKHSNLTGGENAHSGGEVWFIDEQKLVVNANSGRYGAESLEEFEEIVLSLVNCGYTVASMGFDIDNPSRPNAVLVGQPEWRKANDV